MWFQLGKRAMRRTIPALTAIFLGSSAALASVSGGELVGDPESGDAAAVIQKHLTTSGSLAIGQRGLAGGNMILARGDQSGNGPGLGGQKGQRKGGNRARRSEGRDNPNKQRDRDNRERGRDNPDNQQGRGRS